VAFCSTCTYYETELHRCIERGWVVEASAPACTRYVVDEWRVAKLAKNDGRTANHTTEGMNMPTKRVLNDAEKATVERVYKETKSINKAAAQAGTRWDQAKRHLIKVGMVEGGQLETAAETAPFMNLEELLKRQTAIHRIELEEAQKARTALETMREIYGDDLIPELLKALKRQWETGRKKAAQSA
jgi:hypothetical protein